VPFLDDTGVDSKERSPLWSPFTIIADQLERFIVLNVVWAVQWIPALAALAWDELPTPVRVLLIAYSLIAYAPATVVLYGMVRHASHGDPLDLHTALDLLRTRSISGAKAIVPLIGMIGALILGSSIPNVLISALCQLCLMLTLVFSNYWGVLVAAENHSSPFHLLIRSVRLTWKYPVQTTLLTGAVLVAGLFGTISIGGWVLIIPVVIALLQTQMARRLME